jgi:hypothetical protein
MSTKIFISWSGSISHKVAVALRDWLPLVLSHVKPFVSSEDIRKGNQWRSKITAELNETKFGIACLTTDNFAAPWLLFEAGALSRSLEETSVCTLLIPPLKSEMVKGPLSAFQHTLFTKEDVSRLVATMNAAEKDASIDPKMMERVFNKWWGDLEESVTKVLKESPLTVVSERSERDMLIELLDLTRTIARQSQQNIVPQFKAFTDLTTARKAIHQLGMDAEELKMALAKCDSRLNELRERRKLVGKGDISKSRMHSELKSIDLEECRHRDESEYIKARLDRVLAERRILEEKFAFFASL